MNLARHELGFSNAESRFPAKGTCLAIYSRCVNAELPIEDVTQTSFPWCSSWSAELKQLFASYVEAKQQQNVLDYDDLLLYWAQTVSNPVLAAVELTQSNVPFVKFGGLRFLDAAHVKDMLARIHEDALMRRADLVQLEQIASGAWVPTRRNACLIAWRSQLLGERRRISRSASQPGDSVARVLHGGA
jgi:hypothetical protein